MHEGLWRVKALTFTPFYPSIGNLGMFVLNYQLNYFWSIWNFRAEKSEKLTLCKNAKTQEKT